MTVPRWKRVTQDRRATTQGPIRERGFTRISRAGIPKRPLPNCQAGPTASSTPLLLNPQMPWGGHPLLGRPADYLPPGTVGQWLPAPCNGGPCTRAATRKPTKRPRGLTHNSRAGIPKRLRPNCHQRSTLKPAWTASVRKGAGAQRPHCPKGRDPRTLASWRHFAVASCRGNRKRAVASRLGKFDLRPYLLRSSSTKC